MSNPPGKETPTRRTRSTSSKTSTNTAPVNATRDKKTPKKAASKTSKAQALEKTTKTGPKKSVKPKAPKAKSTSANSKTAKPVANKGAAAKVASTKKRQWKLPLLSLLAVFTLLFAVWMVYLDAEVRKAFDGKKWSLPAKVYARPLTLYPGLLLPPEQLEAELQWADYRPAALADRPGTYLSLIHI